MHKKIIQQECRTHFDLPWVRAPNARDRTERLKRVMPGDLESNQSNRARDNTRAEKTPTQGE